MLYIISSELLPVAEICALWLTSSHFPLSPAPGDHHSIPYLYEICLFHLASVPSSFIHVVANGRISFVFYGWIIFLRVCVCQYVCACVCTCLHSLYPLIHCRTFRLYQVLIANIISVTDTALFRYSVFSFISFSELHFQGICWFFPSCQIYWCKLVCSIFVLSL